MKQYWIDVYKGFAIITVTMAHIIQVFLLVSYANVLFLAGYTLHPTFHDISRNDNQVYCFLS